MNLSIKFFVDAYFVVFKKRHISHMITTQMIVLEIQVSDIEIKVTPTLGLYYLVHAILK
jgi:hypothetical protein